MAGNKTPDAQTNQSAVVRTLASYGGMLVSVALALVAYFSFRNALHVALVAFDVYVFAWRVIDIGTALIALVGILILAVADYYVYRKASVNGRFVRELLRQCGIIVVCAALFFFVRHILMITT